MYSFNAGTRTRLYVDMTLDFDPTGSTIEVRVDDTWHPATWQGTPTQSWLRTTSGTKRAVWTQTAQTVDYFAGPKVAAPDGATVLTAGGHEAETRVTLNGDIIPAATHPITVA